MGKSSTETYLHNMCVPHDGILYTFNWNTNDTPARSTYVTVPSITPASICSWRMKVLGEHDTDPPTTKLKGMSRPHSIVISNSPVSINGGSCNRERAGTVLASRWNLWRYFYGQCTCDCEETASPTDYACPILGFSYYTQLCQLVYLLS